MATVREDSGHQLCYDNLQQNNVPYFAKMRLYQGNERKYS